MLIIGYGKLPTKEKQNRKGPKRVEERERERERESGRERERLCDGLYMEQLMRWR